MSTLVRILEAALLLAGIVFLSTATVFLGKVKPKVLVTIENADRATIAIGAAAGNVEKASRAWQAASKSQSIQVTAVVSHVNAAVEHLSAFISRTDDSFNSSLVPGITRAVAQQNASLLDSQVHLRDSLNQVGAVTSQTQKLLADADKQLTDPSIAASLQHIDEATLETAQTMQNVHAETDLILGQTKKAFEPESKLKTIAKMALEGTLNGAELFYYLSH